VGVKKDSSTTSVAHGLGECVHVFVHVCVHMRVYMCGREERQLNNVRRSRTR